MLPLLSFLLSRQNLTNLLFVRPAAEPVQMTRKWSRKANRWLAFSLLCLQEPFFVLRSSDSFIREGVSRYFKNQISFGGQTYFSTTASSYTTVSVVYRLIEEISLDRSK